MTIKKPLKMVITLPIGRCSYPFLAAPDVGREYSDGAWKFDHIFTKNIWKSNKPKSKKQHDFLSSDAKKKGKDFPSWEEWEKIPQTWQEYVEGALLEVARDHFGNPKMKLSEVKKHFIKDLDDTPQNDPQMQNCLMVRCKNKKAKVPITSNIDGERLSDEEVAKIKGGDWVQPIVTIYGYSQSGGGITVGLNSVRFFKAGEPFGGGTAKWEGLLDDIEITGDSVSDEDLAKYAQG